MRFLMRGLPSGARIAALSAAARAALLCVRTTLMATAPSVSGSPRGLASEVAVGAGPMPQVYAPVVSDASHTAGGQGTMVQRLPGGHEIPWRPPATDEIRTGQRGRMGLDGFPDLSKGRRGQGRRRDQAVRGLS